MSGKIDWVGSSGDVWARRWRDTDRGLAPVGDFLNKVIAEQSPEGPFRALDAGCGPGSTALALAGQRRDATIIACDVSESLIEVANQRAVDCSNIEFIVADAEATAESKGPFDLIFSRHGVMFFGDPVKAFQTFRESMVRGGSLVFSCFQAWEKNRWAAELADAAAGSIQPAPGQEAGGFAFADIDYVRELLLESGWSDPNAKSLDFTYAAGQGAESVAEALSFFAEIGPGARLLEGISGIDREAALARMRSTIERREGGGRVEFPAAAWVWTAKAA